MADFDRELTDLAPEARWSLWLQRIEAVLFASVGPVSRAALLRVVGQGVSLDLLLEDLAADLAQRPYALVRVGTGFLLRTRPVHAAAIRAAADLPDPGPELGEFDLAVLAAIACHQPIAREGLREIFGQEIGRSVLARLVQRDLIALGPRLPRRGAPQSFVTTETFLAAFGLESLSDLADLQGFATE